MERASLSVACAHFSVSLSLCVAGFMRERVLVVVVVFVSAVCSKKKPS